MEWLERNGGNWCWEFETSRIWEQLAAVFKGGPSCRASLPGWERPGGVAREPGRSPTWTSIKLLTLLVIISLFFGVLFNHSPMFLLLKFWVNLLLLSEAGTHPGGRPTMPPAAESPASPSFRSNTPYFMFSTGHTCWISEFRTFNLRFCTYMSKISTVV